MSETSCVVRPYRPGDEHGIVALWNVVFGEGAPDFEPRTLAQWRWLWDENPMGRRIMVGVAPDGQIISHYGALPARIAIGGAVHVSAQMIDSMVHPDWRKGLQKEGVFLRTAKAFFEGYSQLPECAVHYGFPNRRVYPIGRRLLKYNPFIAPVPVVFRNFFQDGDDDAVGRDHAQAADVVEVERFPAEVDALWSALAPSYPFAHVRDHAYLRWRYDACPWLPYRRYLIREKSSGTLRGWFVLRTQWQKLPILAVTDWFGAPDDAPAMALALRTATAVARATGHARIEAWLPERHPAFGHALAAGFRTEPGLYVFCMNLFVERPTREEALAQWWYTIGDSDVW